MRDRQFDALRRCLVRAGVAAASARRLAEELRDHHEDLTEEYRAAGLSETEAANRATRRLGDQQLIVTQMLACPQLQGWLHGVIAINDPDFAPGVVRWCAAVVFGSSVTLTLLFAMQIAITS